MELVFQPLFHIARTYVTRFLTLPSATRITNLTSKKKLTEANKAPYLLRNHRHFALPKWKTDRFKNTFILSSCLKYN